MTAPSATTAALRNGAPGEPFRQSAPLWLRHGVPVFPMDRAEKKPLVQRADRIRLRTSAKMATDPRWSEANIGFSPGPASRITVVDIDSPEPSWIDRAVSRYGSTPLMWRTPSGGAHLAYRHAGERKRVRPLKDEPIDCLASGVCYAPPSVRGDGAYSIIAGSLEDLERLPPMRTSPRQEAAPEPPRDVAEGSRNSTLFKATLRIASRVDSFDDLLDCARTINDGYLPPLDDAEVVGVAKSAWSYQTSGQNWCGSTAKAALEVPTLERLIEADSPGRGDAVMLALLLKSIHRTPGITFALSAKAMARDGVIRGWGWKSYASATRLLVTERVLELVRKGGNGPGNPSKYRFAKMVPQGGRMR